MHLHDMVFTYEQRQLTFQNQVYDNLPHCEHIGKNGIHKLEQVFNITVCHDYVKQNMGKGSSTNYSRNKLTLFRVHCCGWIGKTT